MTSACALHRLIYVSHAVGEMDAAAIERILTTARTFNTAAEITGLLLFHDGNFIQIIEGDAARLDALMARIRADRRHGGIIVLESRGVEARVFPEWSMGYAPRLNGPQADGFVNLRRFAGKRDVVASARDADVDRQIDVFLSVFRDLEVV